MIATGFSCGAFVWEKARGKRGNQDPPGYVGPMRFLATVNLL